MDADDWRWMLAIGILFWSVGAMYLLDWYKSTKIIVTCMTFMIVTLLAAFEVPHALLIFLLGAAFAWLLAAGHWVLDDKYEPKNR